MELAVIDDCNILVRNFVNNKSPDFESFHIQWKRMNFQYIYMAQSSTVEILQTTNVIFHIAKRMVCGRDSMGNKIETIDPLNKHYILRRIGGLYLLYAIYLKQPTKQYVKIQVSFQTWMEIKHFIESLNLLPNTYDARYVFWHLYQKDAFRFCALDYHVGLENLVNYDCLNISKSSDENGTEEFQLKYKLNDLWEAQSKITEMCQLEDNYNNAKKELALTKLTSTHLPTSDIFHNIQNNFKILQQLLVEPTQKAEDSEHTSKHALKRKAASFYEDVCKAEKESSSSDDDKSEDTQDVRQKTLRRMSCKSLFIEKLPDSVLNDLEKSPSRQL